MPIKFTTLDCKICKSSASDFEYVSRTDTKWRDDMRGSRSASFELLLAVYGVTDLALENPLHLGRASAARHSLHARSISYRSTFD